MKNKDIVPELLAKIQESFNQKVNADVTISVFLEKVKNGTATMEELSLYGRKLGDHLADALLENITLEVLPDNKMYFNIANRILDTTMHNNYDLVNAAAAAVQKSIDIENGIGLKAIKATYPEERVMAVINGLSDKTASWDTIQSRMDEPVRNISQSLVDDFVIANVIFRSEAGLETFIIRTSTGKCCDWCKQIVGVYRYPDEVPKDVFRRHDYCKCTVVYKSGKNFQNVHNGNTGKRRYVQDEYGRYVKTKEARIEHAKKMAVTEKERQDAARQKRIATWQKKKELKARTDVKSKYYGTATPGKGTIKYDDGLKHSSHKDEIAMAELLHKKFGGDITILNEVNEQSIKTADYIWNGKLWDLKKTTTEKSADGAVRKGLKQIHENPGGIILDYRGQQISSDKLMDVIDRRVTRGEIKEVDIMIIQSEDNINIFKYKK